MRTPFDRLLATADRAIDRVNAEGFILTPMTRPANGRAAPDPERATIRGKAIFDYKPGEAGGVQVGNRSHARSRNDLKTLTTGRTPTLSVLEGMLLDQDVRQGDLVELVDRSGRERSWSIVSTMPDGHGRILIELVQA